MAETKFIKEQAEHEIIMTKLKYSFALKFASMICLSVSLIFIALCFAFGKFTLQGLVFVAIGGLVLALISFITSFRGASMI